MKWTTEENSWRVTHCRRGFVAKNLSAGNAVTLEECRHFNSSGSQCFGGASEWPHLKIDISFRVGEEAHRTELVNKIKALIDTHYQQ